MIHEYVQAALELAHYEMIEGWLLVRNQQNLDIPEINGLSIKPVKELKVV